MHLVELIAQKDTEAPLLDQLETFLVTTLGKGVVRAKDTPNFVANRVGVFSMLATMVHTERFGLGFDVVDALTGPLIGRAKSATYRTADVVGPRHACARHPDHGRNAARRSVAPLLSVAGVARRRSSTRARWDRRPRPACSRKSARISRSSTSRKQAYRHAEGDDRSRRRGDPRAQGSGRKIRQVARQRSSAGAVSVVDIPRPVSLLLRITSRASPTTRATSIWRSAGVSAGRWARSKPGRPRAGNRSRNGSPTTSPQGKALVAAPLPAWVDAGPASDGVHTPAGAYSPEANAFVPRSNLAVYKRQYFPDPILGEKWPKGHDDPGDRCCAHVAHG